jgi:hypothetical protein
MPHAFCRAARAALCALPAAVAPLAAQTDYRNLDHGRPGRVADAYVVERYALELLAPLGSFASRKGGALEYGFTPEVEYGIARNLQLGIGAALAVARDRPGRTAATVRAQYNLNTETALPALGLRLDAHLPLQSGSRAALEAAALLTRTAGPLRVHVNAAYGSDDAWWTGVALDRTLPLRSTLVAAELTASRDAPGAPVDVAALLGVRRQLTPTLVVDAGVGRGLRRGVGAEWQVTLGLTRAVAMGSGSGAPAGAAPGRTPGLWEPRDEQTYRAGRFNWEFLRRYPDAARLFNGFDYGHAILYERLYTRGGDPVARLEHDQLAFIVDTLLVHPPALPLAEEAVAPSYARAAWLAKRVFDWAHVLHRQIYDVYADPRIRDKDAAVARVVAYYQSNRTYALAAVPKRMELMDGQPYSRVFRTRYPRFNGVIWAYHWLQIGLYDALLAGASEPERGAHVAAALGRFRAMLDDPAVAPREMPLAPGVAPRFTERHPAAAAIFDNLHMLHDVISDILISPVVTDRRAAIYAAVARFQDPARDVMTPQEWRDMVHHMGGVAAMGGPVVTP